MTSSNNYSEFIRSRHSARAYLPEPVPAEVIKQVLIDAQSAPSNSNTQPWDVHVVSGEKLHELSDALIAEFNENGINPDFTLDYGEGVHPSRSVELAKKMYGILGIAREDKEAAPSSCAKTSASLAPRTQHFFISRQWAIAFVLPSIRALMQKTSCFPYEPTAITEPLWA